jgi:FkbM family methyltransferase
MDKETETPLFRESLYLRALNVAMKLVDKVLGSKWLERTRRKIGLSTGLHLRLKRFTASASEPLRTTKLLQHHGIDFVIDIGANTGQFAESLYDFGYRHRTLSFEPISEVHDGLVERAKTYPNWTIAERCVIGERDGEVEFNVTDDSVFSSVLSIKNDFVEQVGRSQIVRREKVPMYRLDTILPRYAPASEATILLKVDTQGYEKQVLAGAEETLKHVKGIKIEMPLYPIYEHSEFNFYEIVDFVRSRGFQPYSFHVEGVDLKTGRVNTIDGLFFRL